MTEESTTNQRWIVFHGTIGAPGLDDDAGGMHQHVACLTVGPMAVEQADIIAANNPPPSPPFDHASPMTLAGVFDHEPTDEEVDALHIDQLFGGVGGISRID